MFTLDGRRRRSQEGRRSRSLELLLTFLLPSFLRFLHLYLLPPAFEWQLSPTLHPHHQHRVFPHLPSIKIPPSLPPTSLLKQLLLPSSLSTPQLPQPPTPPNLPTPSSHPKSKLILTPNTPLPPRPLRRARITRRRRASKERLERWSILMDRVKWGAGGSRRRLWT